MASDTEVADRPTRSGRVPRKSIKRKAQDVAKKTIKKVKNVFTRKKSDARTHTSSPAPSDSATGAEPPRQKRRVEVIEVSDDDELGAGADNDSETSEEGSEAELGQWPSTLLPSAAC